MKQAHRSPTPTENWIKIPSVWYKTPNRLHTQLTARYCGRPRSAVHVAAAIFLSTATASKVELDILKWKRVETHKLVATHNRYHIVVDDKSVCDQSIYVTCLKTRFTSFNSGPASTGANMKCSRLLQLSFLPPLRLRPPSFGTHVQCWSRNL